MASKRRSLSPAMADGYIYRLEVDLAMDKDIDAFDDRQQADSCYDRLIGPVVEDVIGRYSKEYQLDIESIEIDLGPVSGEDLPQLLRARLEEELERRLAHVEEANRYLTERDGDFVQEGGQVSYEFDFTGGKTAGASPFDAVASVGGTSAGLSETSRTDNLEAMTAIKGYLLEESVPWTVPADEFRPEDMISEHLEEFLEDGSFVRTVFAGQCALIRFIDLLDENGFELFRNRISYFLEKKILDLSDSKRLMPEFIENIHDCLREGRLPDGFYEEIGNGNHDARGEEFRKIGIDTADIPANKENLATGTAGLVIFHPFLNGFFRNLGLSGKDNAFKSLSAQIEAVHILHHIAAPESKHHSHELVLEKLLCGLPLNTAIPMNWEPNDRTEEEITGLCSAVCSYWKPLNNTSREGLRTAFIARNGLLGREDGNLVLHVESQAIDILMEDLPWEISTILLSWSEDILMVDWQTQ